MSTCYTRYPREISGMIDDVDRLHNQDSSDLLINWRAFIDDDIRSDLTVVPKSPNAYLASWQPLADIPDIRAPMPNPLSARIALIDSPCSGSPPRWLGISKAKCGIQLRSVRLITPRKRCGDMRVRGRTLDGTSLVL